MSRRDDKPWAAPLSFARVDIGCGWPGRCGPRQFRGAVITQLARVLGPRELAPWSNRDHVGEAINRTPQVLYRAHRDECYVVILGPATRDLVATLAYHLTELALPDGEVLPVTSVRGVPVDGEVTHLPAGGWARYRFRTPYWPCASAARRRPRPDDGWRDAWASSVVELSIADWCAQWGLSPPAVRPVHVAVSGVRMRDLSWERPAQGRREVRAGFTCEFVANVLLPPGVGLGGKVAEGMGEIDLLAVTGGVG